MPNRVLTTMNVVFKMINFAFKASSAGADEGHGKVSHL